MDNLHIFQVSQQCRSLLSSRPLHLLPKVSSQHKDYQTWASREAHANGHVTVHVCTHTHTHILPTPLAPLPGNGRDCGKRERSSWHSRRDPLSLLEGLRGAGHRPAAQSNRPAAPGDLSSCLFLQHHTASGMEQYKGLQGILWYACHLNTGAASESKGLPGPLSCQPSWSLQGSGENSALPKPLGHSCL